jgi:hypothetical protein
MTERRIARVGPRPGNRLLVHWREGGQSLIDFSKDIASGPVWAPLRDERLFNKVRVVNDNRVSEWPEPNRTKATIGRRQTSTPTVFGTWRRRKTPPSPPSIPVSILWLVVAAPGRETAGHG